MKTHLVLDLHYRPDEGQDCFAGTHQECIDFAATQTPHFMYKVVPMTEEEYKYNNQEFSPMLTKEEAVKEMREGKKITHFFFIRNQWMTMQGNKIVLEDGYSCDVDEFWADRKSLAWKDGYKIFKEK